jgi:hypothetical protein
MVFATAIWTLFSSVPASAVLLSDLLAGATLTAGINENLGFLASSAAQVQFDTTQ